MIHRGSEAVSREALADVHTPDGTSTWTPVPHSLLVGLVEDSIRECGLTIADTDFAIWRGGLRFFGVISLGGGSHDYAATVGIRNSHDRQFPAAMAIGSRVFCCDNLAFSSEVVIKTRHTAKVLERLPGVVSSGVTKLIDYRQEQDKRIFLYKSAGITDAKHLHDLVVRLYRAKAIPSTAISRVIEEYESPRHPEFSDHTLWSLMNATTEVLKSFGDLQPRTQRLHSVLDSEIASQLLAA
jgi:hypothetical protein